MLAGLFGVKDEKLRLRTVVMLSSYIACTIYSKDEQVQPCDMDDNSNQ